MVKRIITPYTIVIALLCGLGLLYGYMSIKLIPRAEKKLWSIMLETENSLNTYLAKQESYTHELAQDNHTIQCVLHAIASSSNTTWQDTHKNYNSFLMNNKKTMGFKSILLFDTNKNILFSSTNKKIIGANLNDKKYRKSALNKSFERAMMTLAADFAEFIPDPIFKRPALFITQPIINNKKLIGVIAYEYNAQDIFTMIHHYNHLGTTGETALAQKKDSYVMFVAPTRHSTDLAFKKVNLFNKVPLSIQASVMGSQGTGTATDYRSKKVVAAWAFVPKVNWGIVVKIDQSEIMQPLSTIIKVSLLLILAMIVWLIYSEFFCNRPIRQAWSYLSATQWIRSIPQPLKHPFLLLFFLFFSFFIYSIAHYYYIQRKAIQESQHEIIRDTTADVTNIEQVLNRIVFTSQSLVDDLQAYRLNNEDIKKRIKRDALENNAIIGITIAFASHSYNNQTSLYAPTITKRDDNTIESDIATQYNYTNTNDSSIKNEWYNNALKGATWINPSLDEKKNLQQPMYACPFFDKEKKIRGVVSITYDLQAIKRITESNNINSATYSILMADDGTVLFHPINTIVDYQTKLIEIAQKSGNEKFASIAQMACEKKPVLATYRSDHQQEMLIYTHPIKTNSWILATLCPLNYITVQPDTIRLYHFWIIAYATIALLFLCIFLYNTQRILPIHCAFLVNIALTLCLMFLWKSIQLTSIIEKADSTIITDQATLDKFLDDLKEEVHRKNETPPIIVPCGLLLSSLDIASPEHMIISGYVWNKYNLEKHADITHQIQIPHATRLVIENPSTSVLDNQETVTWNIRSTIFQKQNYVHYPFDKQRLQIAIAHHDIQKNVIFIPDLVAYKKISPEETPGLDRNFTLSDLRIEKTFFNYKKMDPTTDLGFKEYGKSTSHYQLVYNIITKRGLRNPFILYFLPLLVVLFSLFAVLVASKRSTDPLTLIASYTGLFFALILLQRSLREQYPTHGTLYMEYAFFFTYITIILLVIHTVIIYLYPNWERYQKTIFPLVKFLFWPLQLIFWIITTFVVFY